MPRYTNLDGTTPDKGLGDILRWQLIDRVAGRGRKRDTPFATPRRDNDGSALPCARGTDHVDRASHRLRFAWEGASRRDRSRLRKAHGTFGAGSSLPACLRRRLPPLDIVSVSHAHYDHMDMPSLRTLAARGRPLFVVPKDNADLLRDAGIERVVELGWWESSRGMRGPRELRPRPALVEDAHALGTGTRGSGGATWWRARRALCITRATPR